MKRTTLILTMVHASIALVSAQGFTGSGPFGHGAADAEEIELTGRIRLAEEQAPVLVVDGREYTLRIPPSIVREIEVTNNREVTIEGFAVERASFDLLGNETVVHVRVFQIDDDRYIATGPPGRCNGSRRDRAPGAERGDRDTGSDDRAGGRGRR